MEEFYNVIDYNTILEKINNDLNNEIYLFYLRKSREDIEYEKENKEYKTLERHQKRLITLATSMGIKVNEDYIIPEVVSGDSIAERNSIKVVLKLIEHPKVKGVWVIDVQRLTRGDLGDQDKIIKTFKYTNTLIMTPEKEYNLQFPADEEYLIDKLAYSRKEYLGIKKRLTEGRKDSVMEGKVPYSRAAFGYERYKLKGQKGYSLRIVPEQAEIVRDIFKMCLEGKGTFAIATELNKLGIPSPNGCKWRKNGIREMLHNKTYIGKVKWQERQQIKIIEDSQIKTKTKRNKENEYLVCDGLHEPIISEEDFEKVQELLKQSSTKYVPLDLSMKNPLSGILRCSVCGKVMARREGGQNVYYSPRGSGLNPKYYKAKDLVWCSTNKECGTVSNNLEDIEIMIIDGLKEIVKQRKSILANYTKNENTVLDNINNQIEIIDSQIIKEEKKLNKLRDFLEDGIYDKKVYIERSSIILSNLEKLKNKKLEINENNEHLKMEKLREAIPKVEKGIKEYYKLDVVDRNIFLNEFIEKVLYTKTKIRSESDLKLDIYPKF